MTDMLQFRNATSQINAVSPDSLAFFCHGMGGSCSQLAAPLINGFLKLKREKSFFSFDNHMREYGLKKLGHIQAANRPDMLWSMDRIPFAVIITANGTSKSSLQFLDDRKMRHPDAAIKLHPEMIGALPKGGDADISFAVKQSCCISNIHRASNEKLANSEKARCPVERRGRVTPNQAEVKASGVRREHVPAAKAKICSELHGNMQRSAEMTGPDEISTYKEYPIRQQIATPNTFSSGPMPSGISCRLAMTGCLPTRMPLSD